MDEDEAFERLLVQTNDGYSRLYPSIVPRLRKAYEAGNPMVKQAVQAMAQALSRTESLRVRRLRDELGLTPSEVRVVLHLTSGGTVASAAEELKVAESTVRSHLKSVFAKTGVNRQSQLGRLLQS